MKLQEDIKDDECVYFNVDPDDLDSLNKSQRQLVNAIYGASRPGKMVYVLDSKYVKRTLKGKEGSSIARGSWLHRDGDGSVFLAEGWKAEYTGSSLLGVLKEVPKAPQKSEVDPITQAYQTILQTPQDALARLTPEIATGLSGLLTQYRKNLQKPAVLHN